MTKQHRTGTAGKVRIIGGQWRGRRIQCLAGAPVRPTGDRVRETLFNWLANDIDGARCLDLFAGTGALGIEALSRGAAATTFVEQDAPLARQIENTLGELGARNGNVVTGDALRYLAGPPEPFDIVFLDPPFGGLDPANLCKLLASGWLAPGALIYIESGKESLQQDTAGGFPPGWTVVRDKTAGRVRFMLLGRGQT